MANGYFELKKSESGKFYFSLKAGNHENILKSEMYNSRSAAENGIASVQKNASDESLYERKESTNGKHYFVLKAKNHQIIGQSQLYNDTAGMDNGIQSVMKNGVSTDIKDLVAA